MADQRRVATAANQLLRRQGGMTGMSSSLGPLVPPAFPPPNLNATVRAGSQVIQSAHSTTRLPPGAQARSIIQFASALGTSLQLAEVQEAAHVLGNRVTVAHPIVRDGLILFDVPSQRTDGRLFQGAPEEKPAWDMGNDVDPNSPFNPKNWPGYDPSTPDYDTDIWQVGSSVVRDIHNKVGGKHTLWMRIFLGKNTQAVTRLNYEVHAYVEYESPDYAYITSVKIKSFKIIQGADTGKDLNAMDPAEDGGEQTDQDHHPYYKKIFSKGGTDLVVGATAVRLIATATDNHSGHTVEGSASFSM